MTGQGTPDPQNEPDSAEPDQQYLPPPPPPPAWNRSEQGPGDPFGFVAPPAQPQTADPAAQPAADQTVVEAPQSSPQETPIPPDQFGAAWSPPAAFGAPSQSPTAPPVPPQGPPVPLQEPPPFQQDPFQPPPAFPMTGIPVGSDQTRVDSVPSVPVFGSLADPAWPAQPMPFPQPPAFPPQPLPPGPTGQQAPYPPAGDAAEHPTAPYRLPAEFPAAFPATSPERGVSPRILLAGGAALAAVALAAVGGIMILSGSGGQSPRGAGQGARPADQVFAGDPAATGPGHDERLNSVAAVDSTVVAAGAESGNIADRAEFLVSADGGTTFRLAAIRTPSGVDNAYGDTPRLISGGAGGWVAIGSRQGDPTIWTSKNGTSWVRESDTAGGSFLATDRVKRLTSTGSGFIAVGDASAKGDYSDARPVVWLSSPDGSRWERLTRLGPSITGGAVSLTEVVSLGNVVLAHAYGSQPSGSTGSVDTIWRSTDSGRTWAEVSVPQSPGSFGIALAATSSSLLLGQNIFAGNQHSALISASTDGTQWSKAGEINLPGFGALIHLSSSSRGQVATVLGDHKLLLARSENGQLWQSAGSVDAPSTRSFGETAATAGNTILVGSESGSQFDSGLLTVLDSQGHASSIPLGTIPGAAPADRQINGLASADGRSVAVGSSNGDAAIWTSDDGRKWTRGTTDLTGPGRRHLLGVTSGKAGWLAVGFTGRDAQQPLVLTSANATAWQSSTSFASGPSGHLVPFAAASGPTGYVVVGEDGSAGAVWHSADLRSWERGTGATPGDLTGSKRWMRSVVGTSFGWVAAGGVNDPAVPGAAANRPAVWTSADGRTWAAQQLPLPAGAAWASLNNVVAAGTAVLAVGTGSTPTGVTAFAFVSADGGKTWQQSPLPQAAGTTIEVAAVATPRGFVISGGTGSLGTEHVLLWSSADGRDWRLERPQGPGLSDTGDHRMAALSVNRTRLLAIGQTADYLGEHPTIWDRPVP